MQETPLGCLPIPLPYPYLQGMDMVKDLDVTGATHANLYLLGELHTRIGEEIHGFNGYFLHVFLFKEPLAIQLLLLWAVLAYARSRRQFHPLRDEIYLLVPVLFVTIYLNVFFKSQIGIRYLLVVLPFLYIFCGSLVRGWEAWGKGRRCALAVLSVYLVVSVMSYFPHYLSYFNEFVWDRTKAYKLLADSNIDWGQSEWYVQQYRAKHPEAIVNPEVPAAGRIVVSVNYLVGLYDPEKYRWLREHFEPVGHVGYSYLVYDVSPESLRLISDKGRGTDE